MIDVTSYQPMDVPSRHLEIGRVWRTTSETFGQATRSFILLGILPVPTAVGAAVPALLAQGDDTVSIGSSVALAGLTVLLAAVAQNASAYGAGRLMAGEAFSLADAATGGFARLPQLIATWILSGIIVSIGLALLIVPGLIAFVALSLAGGACVLERCGPIAALQRSIHLARGNLWRIVGAAALVVGVPLAAIVGVGGTLVGVFYAMHTEFSLVVTAGLTAILAILVVTIFPAIGLVFGAVLFVELRRVKEGR